MKGTALFAPAATTTGLVKCTRTAISSPVMYSPPPSSSVQSILVTKLTAPVAGGAEILAASNWLIWLASTVKPTPDALPE